MREIFLFPVPIIKDTHSKLVCQLDSQCTYNVTQRRIRATIVAVEKQWVLHILSVYL